MALAGTVDLESNLEELADSIVSFLINVYIKESVYYQFVDTIKEN